MSCPTDPDLVKITEIFLIPNSFLVAALGTADTNPHRAGVALIGLVVSALWWVCSHEALAERQPADAAAAGGKHSRRVRIMSWLPIFFFATWAAAGVVHVVVWNRPLGH